MIKKSFISALNTMIRGQALPLGASVTDRDGANEIIAAVSDVLTDDEVCVNAV